MGKQQKTYGLLLVVALIWGLLGYKIVKGLVPADVEDIASIPLRSKVITKPKKREVLPIDTEYRDPFLGSLPKTKTRKTPRNTPTADFPKKEIVYAGSVADAATSSRLYFVSIDGVQHLMQPKDRKAEVLLVRGSETSITVQYAGHQETIQRNP